MSRLKAAQSARLLAVLGCACAAEPQPELRAPEASAPAASPAQTASRPVCVPPVPVPDQSGRLAPLSVPFDPAPIEIEREHKLARFYDALADLAQGKRDRHVRVAVFGDSNLTMDFTTGRMRRQLSRIFGEGGHGFVALGKPWSHYRHMDVEHDVVSGWKAYAMTTSPTGDGLYGLGGIAVEAMFPGGKTFVKTSKADAPVGQAASHFSVLYLQRPKGGRFKVELDKTPKAEIETQANAVGLGVFELQAEEGPHRLDVIADRGPTRVFGAVLEREKPGIIIDSFGVGSLNTKSLGRHDGALFRSMLKLRDYELVIFLLGANDLFTMDAVPDTMRKVQGWMSEAVPDAAMLMVAPPDRGFRRSMPETLRVVVQREALAKELDVAYWDQFRAMGGQGSMRKFVDTKLAFSDAIHYTELGGAFVGDRLLDAFLRGFQRRASTRPGVCAESPALLQSASLDRQP